MARSGSPDHRPGSAAAADNARARSHCAKKAHHPKLSKEERSEIARRARIAQIPTKPHPDNVALAATFLPSNLGMPVREWLLARMMTVARRGNSQISWFAWCGWETARYQLEKRIALAKRRPDEEPLSLSTIELLSDALGALNLDLEQNRPW